MKELKFAAFAVRWIQKFSDPHYQDISTDRDFIQECVSLGFAQSEKSESAGKKADLPVVEDIEELKKTIGDLEDSIRMGHLLYKKWNWCMDHQNGRITRKDRQWFLMMLNRLNDVAEYGYHHLEMTHPSYRGTVLPAA